MAVDRQKEALNVGDKANRGYRLKHPSRPRVAFDGQDAWGELSEQQRAMLMRWEAALHKHACACEAEHGLEHGELLTITFGIACRAAKSYDPAKGFTFGTYLYASLRRTLNHRVVRTLVSEKLRKQVAIPEFAHPCTPAVRGLEVDEGSMPWWWKDLSERERLVVRMLMDGYTHNQIGAMMGVSRTVPWKLMNNVRKRLLDAGVVNEDGLLAAA